MRPDTGRPVESRSGRAAKRKCLPENRVKKPRKPPPQPHVDAAIRYADEVVSGTIPACQWVRLACARFLSDLARDADWPYELDAAEAERVCEFTELMPHTKGKWAQKKELIRLEPWQSFILVNVFGWRHRITRLRRFRTVLIVVPRKNGKSALSAPVGLFMLAADHEAGAEVYCGATSKKQAWEVFRPAREMALKTPDFRSFYGVGVNASNLHVISTGSRFEPVIGKPGDGASPSCAIVDEYHEHDTSDLWDTMLTGMGARDQPILWGITTAGSNIACPCYDEIQTGRKMLQGIFVDDERFFVEWTIDPEDDWTTIEALRKANPNIGVSVQEEFLIARQTAAIRNPRLQSTFKTKHLNLWVNARNAFFNMQSWASCYDPAFSEEALHGRRAVLAMDLASRRDIAALQVLVPLADGRIATFGRYYLPEAAVENADGAEHYRGWAYGEEGRPPSLIVTDGEITDFERIEADIDLLRTQFVVDEIVFDPAQAAYLVTRLMSKGANVIQFDQNARNYSEPMKQVDAEIYAGRIVHGCGPTHPMTWMMSNVEARVDAKEQVFPRKSEGKNKIDGPVALIMGRSRLLVDDGASVYEERGIMVL
ncbi:terminase [Novacetimonas maltaceti]|nr:terminase [Novacetimonas maltaceti]